MRVLVIEDNEDMIENIFEYFEPRGHVMDAARDGLSGLHLAATEDYDAIILDLMLPGIDGLEICHKLRKEARSDIPIVMLTAKGALEDKLNGYGVGVDDYLVKPIALPELEAKLLALLRRTRNELGRTIYRVRDLTFNTETLEVMRAGMHLDLNPVTRNILAILMRESPRVVTKKRLESEIWGDQLPDSDTLRTHIYNLRNTIDRPFPEKLLKTIPRAGYRLASP